MSVDLLINSILAEKVGDAKAYFDQIISEKAMVLAEQRREQIAESLFVEDETEMALTEQEQVVDAIASYFAHLVEEGATVEEALQIMAEDEDLGEEVTAEFVNLIESYDGPEDPEDDEDCDDDDADDDDQSDDEFADPTP